jgi:predicted ATP-grasp superfamily ATP-dependent carboligase
LNRENSYTGTDRPRAVVIGLDNLVGIQTARILARHGVPVVALGDPRHPFCRTNVCERILPAETKGTALIDALVALGPSLGPQKAVLVPCSDEPVVLIARERERLAPWYHVPLPETSVVETLLDKDSFIEFSRNNGFPVPLSLTLESREEALEASRRLSYPCVLKPSARNPRWRQNFEEKGFKLHDAATLLETYDRTAPFAEKMIVQEWIEGGEDCLYSCNVYFDAESKPLVTFVARKLRQWPPITGQSALGEECRNDEVLETTVALFEKARFRGLGYIEMKRDVRTGRHLLVEANVGRPTGRSAIAEAGGVELLYTMYCDTVGDPLPANREQTYAGVKWIYLRSDVQAALRQWLRGELSLRAWWASWRGRKGFAVFSWSDPKPFWLDVLGALRDLAGARGRSFVRRLAAGARETRKA